MSQLVGERVKSGQHNNLMSILQNTESTIIAGIRIDSLSEITVLKNIFSGNTHWKYTFEKHRCKATHEKFTHENYNPIQMMEPNGCIYRLIDFEMYF